MITHYRTVDGDMLDQICWRYYGRHDMVATVLAANPGLAAHGPVYAANLVIQLPDLPSTVTGTAVPAARDRLRLWD